MASLFGKIFDPLIAATEKLSKVHRIAIGAGVFVLLIGGFVYFSFLPKMTQTHELKTQIDDLERNLVIATRKARQLPRYREMKKEQEAALILAKKALPNKKEIPDLLTGISRAGKDAGLDFLLFQPKAEVKKEFYAEIPVSIKVNGAYHNIAIFFDKVARLFRVVNITDISMNAKQGSSNLDTSCTAITYRFLEPKLDNGDKGKKEGKKK